MSHELSSSELADASARLLTKVMGDLATQAASAPSTPTDGPRLFFPRGIENIELKVVVGPATVELRISGGHGNTAGTTAEAREAGRVELLPASASQLAQAILSNSRITPENKHSQTPLDGATALANLRDTAAGRNAKRSSAPGGNPPGGEVPLDPAMLAAILELAKAYTLTIAEIAGGAHSTLLSRHYAGVAFDVSVINGTPVSASHPDFRNFMAQCRKLGATEVLGPGDDGHKTHVHAAWPRPSLWGMDIDEPEGACES